jgi:hypothetical protein
MRYTLLVLLLTCSLISLYAQQPDRRNIRIVDALTTQEKNERNPVILRSELDSLMKQHMASLPQQVPQQPVKEIITESTPVWVWPLVIVPLLLIGVLLYLLLRNQKGFARKMEQTRRLLQQAEFSAVTKLAMPDPKTAKGLDKKVQALTAELDKMKKENTSLQSLLKEYENVKQQITTSYKIRNYPGYEPSKTEEELLKGLLKTEKSVAIYAYEHFLKPVIEIADANKNNPARISKEDREKLVELLISLSLLYIEYLYLRVNELSVGGNMVARIQGLSNGNRLDTILMKQLNTEHGSRALVLRMILDKMSIGKLTYPVFDETNLNLS